MRFELAQKKSLELDEDERKLAQRKSLELDEDERTLGPFPTKWRPAYEWAPDKRGLLSEGGCIPESLKGFLFLKQEGRGWRTHKKRKCKR